VPTARDTQNWTINLTEWESKDYMKYAEFLVCLCTSLTVTANYTVLVTWELSVTELCVWCGLRF